jgi:uncharacterized Zn-finger protein
MVKLFGSHYSVLHIMTRMAFQLLYICCRSECELGNTNTSTTGVEKKKSAYSLAPNRVSCPYCPRTFPWTSSLRRHVLTHTGQKPYKCPHCSLLFTTKSNCDRHLLRKHGSQSASSASHGGGSSSSSETSPGSSSGNYTMRNVPERPYKCNYCPSSTFSTQSNLKKHVQTKHSPVSPGPAQQPLIPRCVIEGKWLQIWGTSLMRDLRFLRESCWSCRSFRMCHCWILWVGSDILKVCGAFNFNIKQLKKNSCTMQVVYAT